MGELGGTEGGGGGGGGIGFCLAANDFLRRVVVRAIRTCNSLTTTCARATQPFDDTFALRVACFNLICLKRLSSARVTVTRLVLRKRGGRGGGGRGSRWVNAQLRWGTVTEFFSSSLASSSSSSFYIVFRMLNVVFVFVLFVTVWIRFCFTPFCLLLFFLGGGGWWWWCFN